MLADGSQNISSGQLTHGIELNSSINSIIDYLQEQLSIFKSKYQGNSLAVEDTLNENLFILLQRNIGVRPYFFKPEKIQDPHSGISAKTDIGVLSLAEQFVVLDRVFNENEAFFEIECKRLPTSGHNREREYVIGNDRPSGGIERFKKGIHGKNLKHSAIIGYVQQNDFQFWLSKINSWIDDLIISSKDEWLSDDKLNKIRSEDEEGWIKLESNNIRIDKESDIETIRILHFWVNLVN